MTPLKEACLIAKGLNLDQLDLLQLWVDLLVEFRTGLINVAPAVAPVNTTTKTDYVGDAYRGVMKRRRTKVRVKRRKAAAKTKPPREPKPLPFKQGNNPTPRKGMKSPQKGEILRQVLETLKQTSGKITATELSVHMDKPAERINNVLSSAVFRKYPGLFREPAKTTLTNGSTRSTYVYWLDGGIK